MGKRKQRHNKVKGHRLLATAFYTHVATLKLVAVFVTVKELHQTCSKDADGSHPPTTPPPQVRPRPRDLNFRAETFAPRSSDLDRSQMTVLWRASANRYRNITPFLRVEPQKEGRERERKRGTAAWTQARDPNISNAAFK